VVQDFAVPAKLIMQQWTARKLSDKQVWTDLVHSRCPRAPAMLSAVATLIAQAEKMDTDADAQRVLMKLESTLGSFCSLPSIDKWSSSFHDAIQQQRFRRQCLLLRGASRTGKTQKALSLFGYQSTLVKDWALICHVCARITVQSIEQLCSMKLTKVKCWRTNWCFKQDHGLCI